MLKVPFVTPCQVVVLSWKSNACKWYIPFTFFSLHIRLLPALSCHTLLRRNNDPATGGNLEFRFSSHLCHCKSSLGNRCTWWKPTPNPKSLACNFLTCPGRDSNPGSSKRQRSVSGGALGQSGIRAGPLTEVKGISANKTLAWTFTYWNV